MDTKKHEGGSGGRPDRHELKVAVGTTAATLVGWITRDEILRVGHHDGSAAQADRVPRSCEPVDRGRWSKER